MTNENNNGVPFKITGDWDIQAKKLKEKFELLTDDDLKFEDGKDEKDWISAKDGMWQDRNGKWLKISDKKLMMSSDNGVTWAPVKNNTWQGFDEMWYMFDKNWDVYTMNNTDYNKYYPQKEMDKNKDADNNKEKKDGYQK